MVFEQAPDLNKHVDPSIPFTWEKRRKAFSVVFPLLAITVVFICERVFLECWLHDRPLGPMFCRVALFIPFLFVLFAALIEFLAWSSRRTKRTLQISDKWIEVRPNKNAKVRWSDVSRFVLEPVLNEPSLTKCSVELKPRKKQAPCSFWSIALKTTEQVGPLKMELERLQRQGSELAPLVETTLSHKDVSSYRTTRLWYGALAMLFVVHGMPLFMIGILGSDQTGKVETAVSPGAQKIGQLLAHYFSTVTQIRLFFGLVGAILLGLAARCSCLMSTSVKRCRDDQRKKSATFSNSGGSGL